MFSFYHQYDILIWQVPILRRLPNIEDTAKTKMRDMLEAKLRILEL